MKTPQLWERYDDLILHQPAFGEEFQVVADLTGAMATGAERDANLRLISAAPQLLDLVRTYWQTRSQERWEREEPEIHNAIRAVVSKAEGWTP